MTNPNSCLQPYQLRAFNTISELTRVKDKRVLEIGGIPPDWVISNALLRRGAGSVFAINSRPDIQDREVNERFRIIHMDANKLDFDSECFDIVMGTAVLEHLINLKGILDQITRVLKPGGYLYLHGGPIWSCKWGHHLWVHVDDSKYEFSGNNPIPDWYHLILDKAEMRNHLLAQNISEKHADRIVDFVYQRSIINRYPLEELEDSLNTPKLNLLSCKKFSWGDPDQSIKKMLFQAGYDSARDFSTGAMDIVLQKPG